ncbi:MAG: type II toxin-antitoxin system Phd/YefM family antitoxin [Deltaproteobacteria bacterium]|nr:type II toxin-antitoxin system Phd/YefM family antitoxin [Deltaproteobacteria bacterium]
MQTVSVHQFRANLKKTADSVVNQHEPIRIARRNGENLILFSEDDWNAEQETLYVLQSQSLMKQIADSLESKKVAKEFKPEEARAKFGV